MKSNSLHSPLSSGEECFPEGENESHLDFNRNNSNEDESRSHRHRKHGKHKSKKHKKHRTERMDEFEGDLNSSSRKWRHQSSRGTFSDKEEEMLVSPNKSNRHSNSRPQEEFEQLSDIEDFPSDSEVNARNPSRSTVRNSLQNVTSTSALPEGSPLSDSPLADDNLNSPSLPRQSSKFNLIFVLVSL